MMKKYETAMTSYPVQLRVSYLPCFVHAPACIDAIVAQYHARQYPNLPYVSFVLNQRNSLQYTPLLTLFEQYCIKEWMKGQ